jgi:hypothetical protein
MIDMSYITIIVSFLMQFNVLIDWKEWIALGWYTKDFDHKYRTEYES